MIQTTTIHEAKLIKDKLIFIDEEGIAMIPLDDCYDLNKLTKLFEAEMDYQESKNNRKDNKLKSYKKELKSKE